MKQLLTVPALFVLLSSGCASRQAQPVVASSADATGYAARYPDALEAARKQLADDKAQAQQLSSGLAERNAELKGNLDPELLLAIVEASDEAGRGHAFAAAHAEAQTVRTFFDEERGPLSSRVSGVTQQKVAEAKCEGVDVSGSVSYALKDGIDKQLEKRLRERNDAQLAIERQKSALGPANVNALQKLADDIALASYLANIALIEDNNRIARMLGERRDIDSTLERSIEDERAYQAGAGRTPGERKASEQRTAELSKSREALASSVSSAEAETKEVDAQLKTAKADYDSALSALKDQIRARPPLT